MICTYERGNDSVETAQAFCFENSLSDQFVAAVDKHIERRTPARWLIAEHVSTEPEHFSRACQKSEPEFDEFDMDSVVNFVQEAHQRRDGSAVCQNRSYFRR
jgi:hypothetical protein